MIAIIDYGAGNLQSVKKALDFIGAESLVTSRASEIGKMQVLAFCRVSARSAMP